MINYYQYGTDVIAIETCCPGHGSMLAGYGSTREAAHADLSTTPIEGHRDPELGVRWLILEVGGTDADFDDVESLDD